MHLFEAIIALNFSICYGFQSLDDLENFYKNDPVFDPFGLPNKIQITLSNVRPSTETSFSPIRCIWRLPGRQGRGPSY